MKKLAALFAVFAILSVFFLFGCTIQSPFGGVEVQPPEGNVTINVSTSGPGGSAGGTGGAGSSGSSGSSAGTDNIVYLALPSGSALVNIDGDVHEYDEVGVRLYPGETADASNWQTLFTGDYPTHSPRDLVIKTRVTNNRMLDQWRQAVIDGNLQRRNIAIEILDANHNQVGRVEYINTWPSAYDLLTTPNTFEERVFIDSEAVEIELY